MKREYVKMRKNDIITGANSVMIIKEPKGGKPEVEEELISIFLACPQDEYALILNNQKYP